VSGTPKHDWPKEPEPAEGEVSQPRTAPPLAPPPPAGLPPAPASTARPAIAPPPDPSSEPATPASRPTAAGEPESQRSTAEFLFELDAPGRATPQDALSSLQAGADHSLQPEPVPEPIDPEAQLDPPAPSLRARSGAASRLLDPAPERFDEEEPQSEDPATLRLRRLVVRVQTVRDAFRLLGALGLDQESRKGVASSLMELEQSAGRSADGPSLIKEPERALGQVNVEVFDVIETKLSAI
jgi:hypothetical protein